MALIINTILRTTSDYCLAVDGIYVSNRDNVLRNIAADVSRAFGADARVLHDGNGKPFDGRTHGVATEDIHNADGVYRITIGLVGSHISTSWVSSDITLVIYDSRIVAQVVDRVLAELGVAFGTLAGNHIPSVVDTEVTTTLITDTTDENKASLVVELRTIDGRNPDRR